MDIAVISFDAAADAIAEQAYGVMAASTDADHPDLPPLSRQRFFGWLRHPMPGDHSRYAIAYLDGTPAGYLGVDLPQLDNLHNASAELHVHPAYRRRGVGRALHRHLLRLVGGLGRKRISGVTVAALPGGVPRSGAGAAFAATMGARDVLPEVRRRLDVTALDQPALDRLLDGARARSTGYTLVRWQGSAPEEYVADVAYLDGRLVEDAPMGEFDWEPEKVDVARVRGVEAGLLARGRRNYHCGARHDATGRLVAWTMLDLGESSPWHAFQQITIVDPNHRGRRLGALLKVENLRYATAREPDLRAVDTWNAAANAHMISINEAMGFRPVDSWHNWQQTL